MKFKFPRRRTLLRWFFILLAVLILLVYIGMPFAFGVYATLPIKTSVGAPPEGVEEISLLTEDNVKLIAWYAPPQNGAVIILVAGAHGTRNSVRPYADMLRQHGFGTLSLDLRGHGESEGNSNQFGWEGTQDIGAAVAFLQTREEVKAIGGLGTSLGGEVVLGAASTYPELQAIVSDGASFRSVEEYIDLSYQRPLHRNFTTRVMYLAVRLFSGDKPPLPIRDSLLAAPNTHFLLIAGGNEHTEVDYNEMFADTVGERATLWVAPKAGHVGAFGRHREEYEQRVISFFEESLLK